MKDGFVHVKTGGSHRDMGVDFGRAVREVLRDFVAASAEYYGKHSRHDSAYARRFAAKNYLPQVARRYPQYLEEVRGIAEGAKVAFEDVFMLTADEELSDLWEKPIKEKCSTVVAWTKGGMFMLHNEDYPPRYQGRLVICQAEPDDAPAFLALTYPYMLTGPSCGMNAAGLAIACDSLNFPPLRRGTLSNFVQRDLYAGRGIEEVERRLYGVPDVTASAATVIATDKGDARMLEHTTHGKGEKHIGKSRYLTHTNHVRTDGPDRRREKARLGSRMRLAVLEHYLSGKVKDATLGHFKDTLSAPELAALRQSNDPHSSVTLASAILDLSKRTMYVAKRGPGGHDFRSYRF